MKKLHSLFILSILALTMFVGCQNPTDDATTTVGAESTEYAITIDSPHGTVELDKTKAKAGETVKLTITPDSGYVLDSLSVKMSDTEITAEISDDKTSATFTMPKGNVSIEATFKTATGTPTPTDDTGNEETEAPVDDKPTDTTPTVDADEATYGFTKTVNYTVVANGQSLPETKTGEELITIAKEKNLVKDTDYTIDGTTVKLTASGVEKYLGNTDNGNTSSGGNTPTYTVSVPNGNYSGVLGSNSSYKLVIQNAPANGYKKGDTVEILITNGSYNVSTGIWGTLEGPYLVKVFIKEGKTELNIEDVKVEDHKITFTMPDKNINVSAVIADMTPMIEKDNGQACDVKYRIPIHNKSKNTAHIVMFYDGKEFDNLTYNENYGKYVWDVCDLEAGDVLFITCTGISDPGTPGRIVNNELIGIPWPWIIN